MSTKTGIAWTEATWNPIRGCTLVSKGCENCYAMSVAARFSGPGLPYEGLARRRSNGKAQWTGKIMVVEKHMLDPIRWQRPRMIFVNSMSDLFHENVADETIDRIFAVMALAPRHTFQILTKRPERMLAYLTDETLQARRGNLLAGICERVELEMLKIKKDATETPWPLPNVWLGTSTENQETADERIPYLLATPAAVRFISGEPLLGGVDLTDVRPAISTWRINALTGEEFRPGEIVSGHLGKLDWVIVGGESGHNARPMELDWARALRDQCQAADVAFFLKQLGGTPDPRAHEKAVLDGHTYTEMPPR